MSASCLAKSAAEAMAAVPGASVVDGIAMASAGERGGLVYTSDFDPLARACRPVSISGRAARCATSRARWPAWRTIRGRQALSRGRAARRCGTRALCSNLLHNSSVGPGFGERAHVLQVARREPLHLRKGGVKVSAEPVDDARSPASFSCRARMSRPTDQ
jgi:hypothetical protein